MKILFVALPVVTVIIVFLSTLTTVPEPETGASLMLGLAGLIGTRMYNRKNK